MRTTRFQSRFVAKGAAAASLFALLGTAGMANARATYPGVVQTTLKATCPPQCTLCHTVPEGGPGNYKPSDLDGAPLPINGSRGNESFFANLIRVGSGDHLPSTDAQLKAALTKLATKPCDPMNPAAGPCDSDGDGLIDTLEFKNARDPDEADPSGKAACPQYGCGVSLGRLPHEVPDTGRAATVMALLGVGLVLVRRARR